MNGTDVTGSTWTVEAATSYEDAMNFAGDASSYYDDVFTQPLDTTIPPPLPAVRQPTNPQHRDVTFSSRLSVDACRIQVFNQVMNLRTCRWRCNSQQSSRSSGEMVASSSAPLNLCTL